MRLVLARHGETNYNKEHRIQGLVDLELNDTGRRQAQLLAEALKSQPVSAIYSSPLRRAWETAALIAQHHRAAPVILDGLKEIDAGEVDGLTYEEMGRLHADFLIKWMGDCTSVTPPGGCSLTELQQNVWGAVQEILRRERSGRSGGGPGVVIAVTHFFPILSVICTVLGLDLAEVRRFRLDLASLCTFEFNPGQTVLLSLNDTCHLREPCG